MISTNTNTNTNPCSPFCRNSNSNSNSNSSSSSSSSSIKACCLTNAAHHSLSLSCSSTLSSVSFHRHIYSSAYKRIIPSKSAGAGGSFQSDYNPPNIIISAAPASANSSEFRGIPTRLNNIPHSREIRKYFYDDVLQATQRAVVDGRKRLKVEISIPELNPATDVYRIGTLMELVRVIALSFADDGKRVKVCVQGSMGEGSLAGMPLQLAGTRKILEYMDWGDYEAKGTFINIGSIGGKEVEEEDDMFILVAPQNAVGNCIIDDLRAMTDAAGSRPVILINPRLKDLPGSSGIMQTMGRDKRLEYAASFENCYQFRLLYYAGTQYPIMGALRMAYPYPYQVYKRVDEGGGKESYALLSAFEKQPTPDDINDAFLEKPRKVKSTGGIWGFLSDLLN